jgi:hypothetical protein
VKKLGFFFCIALSACAQESPEASAQIASDADAQSPSVKKLTSSGFREVEKFGGLPAACESNDPGDTVCDPSFYPVGIVLQTTRAGKEIRYVCMDDGKAKDEWLCDNEETITHG